jgi:hypothetical protein
MLSSRFNKKSKRQRLLNITKIIATVTKADGWHWSSIAVTDFWLKRDAANDLSNPKSYKLVRELSAKILNDRKNSVNKAKH